MGLSIGSLLGWAGVGEASFSVAKGFLEEARKGEMEREMLKGLEKVTRGTWWRNGRGGFPQQR